MRIHILLFLLITFIIGSSYLSAQTLIYEHDLAMTSNTAVLSYRNSITGVNHQAADNFNGLSDSISEVMIAGVFMLDDGSPAIQFPTDQVLVTFYEFVSDPDSEEPQEPAWDNPLYSFQLTPLYVAAGFDYTHLFETYPVFGIMVELPYSIYMPSGWLSVQFIENMPTNRSFRWLAGIGEDATAYYKPTVGAAEELDYDLFFALAKSNENNTVVIDPEGGSSDPGIIVTPGGTIPEELLGTDTGVPAVVYSIQATGTHNIVVQKPAQFGSDWYCWLKMGSELFGGTEIIPGGVSSWVFEDVAFPTKSFATIVINDNPTLPVELSSFTAVLTAELDVKIAWVAESETNHSGYNVLRGESEILQDAIMINPQLIQDGEQQGTQMRYSFLDHETQRDMRYCYWLESVSLDGICEYFGPLSVMVEGEADDPEIPQIPLHTKLISAFPNPFNPNTNLRYSLEDAGDVRIEIFNLKGQLVKGFVRSHAEPGYYQVQWDGKDSSGQLVSSGVYLYRMSSGTYSETKKMVMSK